MFLSGIDIEIFSLCSALKAYSTSEASDIPSQGPIKVLTRHNAAWLLKSDTIRHPQM